METLWQSAITEWARSMRGTGRPRTTIRTRTQHLNQLARDAADVSPWQITLADLLDWLGSYEWARETRHAARSSLRAFYSWAALVGHIAESPAAQLPPIPRQPPSPRPLPDDLYYPALAAADSRVRLMMRLAAESGLRRGEVSKVHAHDLFRDLTGWSLRVQGKGDRERNIPLPDPLAKELSRWCAGGFAFPGADHGHLSALWVGKLVGNALPPGWGMHSLRHRFATRAYSVDRDVLTVQELLGHASPETTRRYVAVPRESLRRTVMAIANKEVA